MGSLDPRSSHALILSNICAGTGSVLIRCRPKGICCDSAFSMMVRKIFSPFWRFVGILLLLSLSQLRILKLMPDIIFSNRVPLVSAELEY